MTRPRTCLALHPGDVVHGFAGGALGRDAYDCSRVEATGFGWVVLRQVDYPHGIRFAALDPHTLQLLLDARTPGEDCTCQ